MGSPKYSSQKPLKSRLQNDDSLKRSRPAKEDYNQQYQQNQYSWSSQDLTTFSNSSNQSDCFIWKLKQQQSNFSFVKKLFVCSQIQNSRNHVISIKFYEENQYRVFHSEVCKVNQLWGVEGSIILLNYGA